MIKLDLGEEIEIQVKWKGQTYNLREPMVEEIDKFRDDDGAEGTQRVTKFLGMLGMPEDVVNKMGMSKARELIDGLVNNLTKKK